MKKTSKVLLLTFCAVLLVVGSILGTLAYLTSQDEVINTFTVGNVAITLDEKDVDNSTENAERDKENAYKLIPGHTYVKDPTIHVDANSEDCYLFVKVENEISDIEPTADGADADKRIDKQMATNGWTAVESTVNVYVYTKSTASPYKVRGNADIIVFEKFTIDNGVKNNTLANFSEKKITVTAYAIQADGFDGKTAADIWTAAKNFS
ncbi:MAG: SipW-dependent-type signal peptide-containing protein [Eubacteriales bacterium]|nr:SipW-dependent-type signal peptide-containing protein [Eubacteriales bacterium]